MTIRKLLVSISVTMVLATTPLPQRIVYAQTLNDYLSMAAANNPMLQARYQEYLAALEKIPQARALPDPELTINTFVSHNGLYMDRFMGQQLSEISLMQMLP